MRREQRCHEEADSGKPGAPGRSRFGPHARRKWVSPDMVLSMDGQHPGGCFRSHAVVSADTPTLLACSCLGCRRMLSSSRRADGDACGAHGVRASRRTLWDCEPDTLFGYPSAFARLRWRWCAKLGSVFEYHLPAPCAPGLALLCSRKEPACLHL